MERRIPFTHFFISISKKITRFKCFDNNVLPNEAKMIMKKYVVFLFLVEIKIVSMLLLELWVVK